MSVAVQVLMQTAALTAGSENPTPAMQTRMLTDKISMYCQAAGEVVAKVVPNNAGAAGTPASAHILGRKTFAAGEAYTWPEIGGTTLEKGDVISFLPATGCIVNARVTGRYAT